MPTLKWIEEHVETVCIKDGEKVCANCAHFHQHYIAGKTAYGVRYFPISWGHCAQPRLKGRNALDRCPRFERRQGE